MSSHWAHLPGCYSEAEAARDEAEARLEMEQSAATAKRQVIQVVSGFRPDVDGMGDYARHLAEEMWRQSGAESEIVVLRRPRNGGEAGSRVGWRVIYADSATGEGLSGLLRERMRAMPEARVLLHYGPYAYTSDGLPLRFAREICELGAGERLAVFFHEMWAHGWPWRRAFWTRGNQMRAVRALLASARMGFSSSGMYLSWLEGMNDAATPLRQVRIFSNMGELERPLPLSERERQLVVFGQRETRVGFYRQYGGRLARLCRILGLDRIVDVGSGVSAGIPARIGDLPVERAGFLSEGDASALMATSVAGVVRYWPDKWEKSGVLASYQAHGMVPLIARRGMEGFRAFEAMPFALVGDVLRRREAMSASEMQTLADRGHEFYRREVALARAAERVIAGLADGK